MNGNSAAIVRAAATIQAPIYLGSFKRIRVPLACIWNRLNIVMSVEQNSWSIWIYNSRSNNLECAWSAIWILRLLNASINAHFAQYSSNVFSRSAHMIPSNAFSRNSSKLYLFTKNGYNIIPRSANTILNIFHIKISHTNLLKTNSQNK